MKTIWKPQNIGQKNFHTNSDNPDDMMRAKFFKDVCEFKTKPLTKEMLDEIQENYFQL